MKISNGPLSTSSEKSIVFNASKNELFKVNDNFRIFQRKIKASHNILVNKETITEEILKSTSLFICTGPREQFTINELNSLKSYLDDGGSVLIALNEEGEKSSTNINFLLEQYGVMVNNDCVIRCHYYKYFHPKECFISNGVLNRGIADALKKEVTEESLASCLQFVYPYGATLNVIKPSVAVFSTGTASCPLNRPIVSFYSGVNGGKLVVVGSGHMFSDTYIEREENDKLRQVIFSFLVSDDIRLNQIDANDADITDYNQLPEIGYTSSNVKSSLMEYLEIMDDYHRFFNMELSKVDMTCVPLVLDAYDNLKVKREPLTLIPPTFETPLPLLKPAVFPPSFRNLSTPHLELFDLEEELSSSRTRLTHLTNKFTNNKGFAKRTVDVENNTDLEYFIHEAAIIMNIKFEGKIDPQAVLHRIVTKIVEFKNNR